VERFASIFIGAREDWNPLASLAYSLLVSALILGAYHVYLKTRDREPVDIVDMFNVVGRVVSYFLATFITVFLVAIGIVLLIVPGIIVAVRLSLIPFVVLDEGAGPLDALQRSWDLTRGFTIDLFLFFVLLVGINVLGLLALGIGLFVTLPISAIAFADMYRFLKSLEADASVPADDHAGTP
jgi:uncharacterized membrane protein